MEPRRLDARQHSSRFRAAMYLEVEWHLRAAGRSLEWAGVGDPDAARLAGIVFRLAQRVAVDSGRLEAAA
jgi:hypothetical protein